MTENVAGKKQNYFKPMVLDQEGSSILQRAVALKSIILIKDEKAPANVEYTKIQASKADRTMLYARLISGPSVAGPQITLMIEVDRLKYFAQAKLVDSKANTYELKLENMYELQRRNFYRVSLPPSMFDAKFELNDFVALPMLDLAVGGCAVAFDPKDMKKFEIGTTLKGHIKIGGFGRLAVELKVRHRRRRVGEKGPFAFVAGCEMGELNQNDLQELSTIVNECHRQYFMRLKK